MTLAILPASIVGLIHLSKANNTKLNRPFYSRWYIAFVFPLAIPLCLVFLGRTFFFQPFNIPSSSSVPSLMAGDYVLVSKSAYKKDQPPTAGDIAVFKSPSNERIDYVKRIVGVPGDRIQMVKGVLHINDVAVKLEEVQLPPNYQFDSEMKFFRETLPSGRSYVIADLGESSADDTEEYLVPSGHYFTLGDNRDNSQDSRYLDQVGYIPQENFIGPVVFRFWNGFGLSLLDRPEEIYPNP
jgi:signal peptidase I